MTIQNSPPASSIYPSLHDENPHDTIPDTQPLIQHQNQHIQQHIENQPGEVGQNSDPPRYERVTMPSSINPTDILTAQSYIRATNWHPNDNDIPVILADAKQQQMRFQMTHEESTNVVHYDGTLNASYHLHRLTHSDSLRRIALLYCTSEDEIKLLNGKFASSDVHLWEMQEIRVPVVSNPRRHVMMQVHEQEDHHQNTRNRFIMAAAYFMSVRPNASQDEAAYYILLHEGHVKHALKEYDTDIEWERGNLRDFEAMRQRVRKETRERMGMGRQAQGCSAWLGRLRGLMAR